MINVAFSFMLKDVSQFEQAVADSKETSEVKSDGNLKYVIDDDVILGWKGLNVLVVGLEEKGSEAQLKAKLLNLLNTPLNESLPQANQRFKKLDGENHDLAFWADQVKLNTLNQGPSLEDADFTGRIMNATQYSTGGINFKKGEINGSFVLHLDPKKPKNTRKCLIKAFRPNTSKAFLSRSPAL
ncbi:MAG: DUF4836 family protein [Bacteroidia bacterium]|nr:DUF4836 family protein [Bacteroidia bacterium]